MEMASLNGAVPIHPKEMVCLSIFGLIPVAFYNGSGDMISKWRLSDVDAY